MSWLTDRLDRTSPRVWAWLSRRLGVDPDAVCEWGRCPAWCPCNVELEPDCEHARCRVCADPGLCCLCADAAPDDALAERCYRPGCDGWVTGASDFCCEACEREAAA